MPIKGMFNKSEKSKITSIEEFEKQVLRINMLEVQLKQLLNFEKQVRLSFLEAAKGEKTKKHGTGSIRKSEERFSETEFRQELYVYNKKLDELKKRINKYEQQLSEIEQTIQDNQHREVLNEEKDMKKKWIREVVEGFLSETFLEQTKKEQKMNERLVELERKFSIQMSRDSEVLKYDSNVRESSQELMESIKVEKAERKEVNAESLNSKENLSSINNGQATLLKQVEDLIEKCNKLIESTQETNNRIMSENLQVETDNILLERVEELLEKCNELIESKENSMSENLQMETENILIEPVEEHGQKYKSLSESRQETEDETISENQQKDSVNVLHQEPIVKTVYIEKLYLDKYEQNNNFAQIGIKELSGTLNIGATYGNNAIPKKVIEGVQKDIETIKADKEKMKENENIKDPLRAENGESSDSPQEEEFSEVTIEEMDEHEDAENESISKQSEFVTSSEEDFFTNIDIDEVENQENTERPSSGEPPDSPMEDIPYTEIKIEDDPSNGEGSF